jgi:multisubunit Na+/H+ antiporter MnhB subunit
MMRHSLIFDATVRLVFDTALIFSLYLLFAGHNQPGGGFVGGLVAAAALAMRYLASGLGAVRDLIPVPPWWLLSAGMLIASTTTMVPLLFGRALLDQGAVEWKLPLLGKVKVTSALPFDTGVYLIVVALLLMAFEGLADDDLDDALDAPDIGGAPR